MDLLIEKKLNQLIKNGEQQQQQQQQCKRILWVMGFSWHDETFERINQIKYAITTQKLRAPSLLPMLMYDGPLSNSFVSWLQANGVIICNFQPSIKKDLEDAYLNKQMHGIFYRMVVNEFIEECIGKKENLGGNLNLKRNLKANSGENSNENLDVFSNFKEYLNSNRNLKQDSGENSTESLDQNSNMNGNSSFNSNLNENSAENSSQTSNLRENLEQNSNQNENLNLDAKNSIFYETIDENFVLYTDSDVGFFRDIDSCNIPKPKIISFGAEFTPGEISNTGVLIFNLPEYLKYQPEFLNFCREKQWKAPTWDQEFYQEFFRDKNLVDQLPDTWNWKPYWGYKNPTRMHINNNNNLRMHINNNINNNNNSNNNYNDITIVHFHGPKPGMKCLDCLLEKKVRTWSKNSLSCEDCNWSYEEIFSFAQTDNFRLYQDLVSEWKRFVYESAPYYDNKNKELVL